MPLELNPLTGVSKIQDGTVDTSAKLGTGVVTPAKTSGFVLTQPNQTPLAAAGSNLVWSHGLGTVPLDVSLEFVCLVAEFGFSAGDVVKPTSTNGTYWVSPVLWYSNTQVGSSNQTGTTWVIFIKGSSTAQNPTPANWAWRFKVRAA